MSKLYSRLLTVFVLAAIVAGALFVYSFLVKKYENEMYPRLYGDIVSGCAEVYAVPEHIIYAVIRTESGFDEYALSSKGAVGLMQITPDTFNWLLSKTGESLITDDLYKPDINIRYGVYFLSMIYSEFGDWRTAYAAYNAGMTRVRGWLDDPELTQNGKLVNIPFNETSNYVERVADAADTYKRLYYQ